jgi:hypothetical protein
MRRLGVALALVLGLPLAGGRLMAQDPMAPGGERVEQLRRQIEDRFAARAQEELGLNDEQFRRLRLTSAQFAAERRGVEQQERRLRLAMATQLRPGVAADQDSVARLIDALINVRGAYVETYREEMKSLGTFLNPVQRAQYLMLRERLMSLAQEVRAGRRLTADSGATAGRRGALRQRLRP